VTAYLVQCRDGLVRIIHADTRDEACRKMAGSPRRLEVGPSPVLVDLIDQWTPAPEGVPEVSLVFELDWEALLRLRAAGITELRDA
jgi:hypothetical protein